MTQSESPTSPPAPVRPSRWRRWRRGFVRFGLGSVLVLAALAFGGREALRLGGGRELARVTADLDAAEPGWRLETINTERERTIPSPDENGAELVRAAKAAYPPDGELVEIGPDIKALVHRPFPTARWHNQPPANVIPRPDELVGLADALRRYEPALVHARRLHIRPRGGTRMDFTDLALNVPTSHASDARGVAQLLRCEADLAAVAGDGPTAADRIVGVVNSGRAIGDEPMPISQLLRLHIGKMAARAAIQAVAWSELPDPHLARLQSALADEFRQPILLWAARGERAVGQAMFEAVRTGRAEQFFRKSGPRAGRTIEDRLFVWARRGALPADQAAHLRLTTEFVRLAGLPPAERFAAAERWQTDLRELTRSSLVNRIRYQLTFLMTPAVEAIIRTDAQRDAEIGCAIVLLGCERFRLKHGRWPSDLDELPAELRPLVPVDPYTGRSLIYRRLPDGVVVYSVGPNRVDDGGSFAHEPNKQHGPDIGFRLWDPDQRRKPAPPAPPAEEPPPTDPEEP